MKKHIIWLVALNAIIIAVALLMIIAGVASTVVTNKIEKSLGPREREKLEFKLGEYVGRPYTEDIYKQQIKTLHSLASIGEKGIETLCSYSSVMYQLGGATFLSAIVSLFVLWRLKRLCNQSEQ